MNARDIVRKFLADTGCDGLTNGGCGCGVNDLMPCEYSAGNCVPAKRVKCNRADCPNPDDCRAIDEENGWCYRPVKTTN